MTIIVTMKSGEKHYLRGYVGEVAKEIENGEQNEMALIPLERDTIPTGEKIYLNPKEVESVKESGRY